MYDIDYDDYVDLSQYLEHVLVETLRYFPSRIIIECNQIINIYHIYEAQSSNRMIGLFLCPKRREINVRYTRKSLYHTRCKRDRS